MPHLAFSSVALLLVLTPLAPADDAPKKAETGSKDALVGTWKLTTARYNGRDFAFPEGFTTMKMVTPGRYMVVIFHKDGSVARASGGTYRVEGDTYEETPEFSTSEGFDNVKGKLQAFKWKVEGGKWHHGGTLSTGMVVEEVWERAEAK